MGTIKLRYYFLGLVTSLISITEGLSSDHNEIGLYPAYNFSDQDYDALTQNFCAIQDHRGIMYFGNNQRILEYDGVNWNHIEVGSGSKALSMDMDEEGRIYVGSDNDFGYLEVDSSGTMAYLSLSDRLPEEFQDFGYVRGIHVTDQGVVFCAYQDIFIWSNDSIHTISGEEEIFRSYLVNGKLYINLVGPGLFSLDGINLINIKGAEPFIERPIYGMLPWSDEEILVITSSSGLYKMRFQGETREKVVLTKIQTEYDELFKIAEIDNAIRINEGLISLGTYGNGALIIDTSFNLVTILNKKSGIRDEVVEGQYIDRTGNLWLALSDGLSRIEIQSPITHFNDELMELNGRIESISRFNNTIYAATNLGLYYMDHEYYSRGITDFSQPVFRMVENTDVECWDLLTYRNGKEEILLLVTNDGIFEVSRDNKLNSLLDGWIEDLYQSNMDPSRVYIGLGSGLASMYRKNGTWIQEGQIEGITELINSITEDHQGNLWLGTEEEGVLKMYIRYIEDRKIGETVITRYNEENGLPEGHSVVSQLKGPLLVGTSQGLYYYNLREDSFTPDSSFGIPFVDGSHYIHRLLEYNNPEYWTVSWDIEANKYKYITGYFTEISRGLYDWISEPFMSLSEGLIHAMYLDPDGIVWLGGDNGLFRYDPKREKEYKNPFHAYIRNVEFSEGGLAFGGTYMDERGISSLQQPGQLKPLLPYRNNSLVFNWAALDGEDESFMRYSYFLEGNDKNWSDWGTTVSLRYTNLHEKNYTFHVKARNKYGVESSVATYEFTILAPWFRKWWAYALYVILAGLVVYTIVIVYTRQLREIIRERTAEVVAQKEVIEEKNQDIMASIQYAEKIQRAMLPPEDDLSILGLDGFILFLPRDVVSGDFYWLSQHEGKTITVAADCTGHGVPGAFMSMLGVAFLNKIVEERRIMTASHILDELRAEVIGALKQKGHEGEQKDGMDLALHVIDHKNMKMEFAGANNPLLMIRNNEIIQVKGDRMPIGIHERVGEPFENHEIDLLKDDCFYIFSDGYQDQFGGPNNKKFMIKKMKQLILDIHQKPMEEQKEILWKAFRDWIEPYDTEQIDDVILIGVRI
jgi:serine phosphatase RsbU (regulator of sigma subunit)